MKTLFFIIFAICAYLSAGATVDTVKTFQGVHKVSVERALSEAGA